MHQRCTFWLQILFTDTIRSIGFTSDVWKYTPNSGWQIVYGSVLPLNSGLPVARSNMGLWQNGTTIFFYGGETSTFGVYCTFAVNLMFGLVINSSRTYLCDFWQYSETGGFVQKTRGCGVGGPNLRSSPVTWIINDSLRLWGGALDGTH